MRRMSSFSFGVFFLELPQMGGVLRFHVGLLRNLRIFFPENSIDIASKLS
jgi:hypothetical protein